jgi:hypothetical protein
MKTNQNTEEYSERRFERSQNWKKWASKLFQIVAYVIGFCIFQFGNNLYNNS